MTSIDSQTLAFTRRRAPAAAVGVAVLIGTLAMIGSSPASAAGITYIVNSTGVQADMSAGDGICRTSVNTCTLRAALGQDAADGVPSRIEFNIAGGGPHQIPLTAGTYLLADPGGGTVIDGYSQPGSAPNTAALGSNASIRIEVVGRGSGGPHAFDITTPDNTVRGLAVRNSRAEFRLFGPAATGNSIVGNFIGTNAAGTATQSVFNNMAIGVFVADRASGNFIGSPALADRNVVAGNAGRGIALFDIDTNDNVIRNNLVGLTPSGMARLANLGHGVDVNTGSKRTIVGGYGPNDRNVISGNGGVGGETSHGVQTRDNQWIGNFFGTDVTGNNAPTWARNGQVNFSNEDKVVNTLIAGNVFVNNDFGGVKLHKESTGTRLENNLIGVTLDGTPSSNGPYGVQAELGVNNNTVGPGNTIAHNDVGVRVTSSNTQRIRITGNSIHSNAGLGIDISPLGTVNQNDPGDGDAGPNTMLNFPVLTSATGSSVTGSACAGCRVEVFQADSLDTAQGLATSYGEGVVLLGSAVAGTTGVFTVQVPPSGNPRTATSVAIDPLGNTSEFSRNLAIPVGGGNLPPTAGFTSHCDDLDCTFDGSGSTDGDGTVIAYSWDFGDGAPAADGPLVNHTFAASGTYSVTLTVTDDDGATDMSATEVTANEVTVPSDAIAEDSFSRVVSSGWGVAPIGGAWTPRRSFDAANLSVDGNRAQLTVPPGTTRGAFLESVSTRDVDLTAAVASEGATSGWGAYVALAARKNNAAAYQARVRFQGDGQVGLSINRNDTRLGTEVVVPGITWQPGEPLQVRFRVTGASPTTLEAKVWASTESEPVGWLVVRTDTDASLQGNGSIGVLGYVTSTQATSGVVSVDHMRAALP